MTGRLSRRFYRREPVTLAKALLGQTLVRRLDGGVELTGRIVEVEAYLGVEDAAAHSFGGRRTPRNESMWLDGGHAYVYFVYGMHWCFNVVAERDGRPSACLVRAVEPLSGIDAMRAARGREKLSELGSGPAKLAQAFVIDRELDGEDLVSSERLFIRRGSSGKSCRIASGPRVGVDYAGEWARKPLRFWIEGHPHVSPGKRAPKQRKAPPP